MKVTKRQLRRIIRESLEDDPRMKRYNRPRKEPRPGELERTQAIYDKIRKDDPEFAAEWMHDKEEETDVARDVEAAITKYTGTNAGRMQWKMSRNDFYNMADGEVYPGISDTYYVGWTPADFEAVIAGVEG
jgi:hypothetical protein